MLIRDLGSGIFLTLDPGTGMEIFGSRLRNTGYMSSLNKNL
jgi:hypothetical protein